MATLMELCDSKTQSNESSLTNMSEDEDDEDYEDLIRYEINIFKDLGLEVENEYITRAIKKEVMWNTQKQQCICKYYPIPPDSFYYQNPINGEYEFRFSHHVSIMDYVKYVKKLSKTETEYILCDLNGILTRMIKNDKFELITPHTLAFIRDKESPIPKMVLSPLSRIISDIIGYECKNDYNTLINLCKSFHLKFLSQESVSNPNKIYKSVFNPNKIYESDTINSLIEFLEWFTSYCYESGLGDVGTINNICSSTYTLLNIFNSYSGKKEIKKFDQSIKKPETLVFIGEGSYGKVYKTTLCTNEIVAIKEPHDESDVNYLKKEARVMQSCTHENIIKFLGYYENDNVYHIVMEFCDMTLEYYYREYVYFEYLPDFIHKLMHQFNNGIKYLHEKQHMIHRDISPYNILLKISPTSQNITVKITDFGFCRTFGNNVITTIDVGNQIYNSPEIDNEHPYNDRSELFSIGKLLIFLSIGYDPDKFQSIRQKGKSYCPQTQEHHPRIWKNINFCKRFMDLISKLIKEKGDERMPWSEYFDHPFFRPFVQNEFWY
ncbi:Protein kinase domain-containing protein [Entamoeba marina]